MKFIVALLAMILFVPAAEAHGHWTVNGFFDFSPGYYYAPPPPVYYVPQPYYYAPPAPVYVQPPVYQAPAVPTCQLMQENMGGYLVWKQACLASDGHWYFVN